MSRVEVGSLSTESRQENTLRDGRDVYSETVQSLLLQTLFVGGREDRLHGYF